jgi:hypothetical protein
MLQNKRGKKITVIIILITAIVVLAGFLLYNHFFYIKNVDNQEEFNSALLNCRKVSYVNDGETAVWIYNIKGENKEYCDVEVTLVSVKEGVKESGELEGKSMVCSVPSGLVISPESNLKNCHGLLKEEMQDLLIENMHKYISTNIQEISKEFEDF